MSFEYLSEDSLNEDSIRSKLILECIKAKDKAYCPYSSFRVGCAVLTDDNKIISGCNVENASYGLSICAERTALVKAVSEGYTRFKEIAVTTDVDYEFLAPCGACRQFIAEFGLDINLLLVKNRNEYRIHSIREILPMAFDSSTLRTFKENAKQSSS